MASLGAHLQHTNPDSVNLTLKLRIRGVIVCRIRMSTLFRSRRQWCNLSVQSLWHRSLLFEYILVVLMSRICFQSTFKIETKHLRRNQKRCVLSFWTSQVIAVLPLFWSPVICTLENTGLSCYAARALPIDTSPLQSPRCLMAGSSTVGRVQHNTCMMVYMFWHSGVCNIAWSRSRCTSQALQ